MLDGRTPGHALPSGTLVGLCRRCHVRYSQISLCPSCLHDAQSDVNAKRGVLLADIGGADSLSALA